MNDPSTDEADERSGGDPACWANLVCPACGAVTTEGHHADCALIQSVDPSD